MEMKNLRVAMIPINSANGIDQRSDYEQIFKAIATRSDCMMIPITDYFQMQNDEELPEHWSFLMDTDKRVDLTGTNIDGIHQHNVDYSFKNGRQLGDATLELVQGSEVIEEDGNVATVVHIYDATHVSLSIEGYKSVERDSQTHIDNIRLPEVS